MKHIPTSHDSLNWQALNVGKKLCLSCYECVQVVFYLWHFDGCWIKIYVYVLRLSGNTNKQKDVDCMLSWKDAFRLLWHTWLVWVGSGMIANYEYPVCAYVVPW